MRVALVSMPFYSAFSACYQIEYLRAILERNGYAVDCHHLNYRIGRRLVEEGHTRFYKSLTATRFLGDYLVLARARPENARTILAEMTRVVPESTGMTADELRAFYSILNSETATLVAALEASEPGLVGFSATHYQLVSSLHAASEVRARIPDAAIVLGGYLSSPASARDVLAQHSFLDAVVFGEGEAAVVTLAEEAAQGRVQRRVLDGGRTLALPAVPSYDRFIERELRDDDAQRVAFGFELSRGCYWDKCDFCNFNAAYGRFRRFDHRAVVAAMVDLHARHGATRFQFLDTSLPPAFANALLKEPIEQPEWDVFAEIMPDHRSDQLRALRSFGVRRAQIGIESFSSDHLRAMRKNSVLKDNLHSLRICAETGVQPVYGMLVMRPGDEPEHYRESARIMPSLHHLEPPKYVSHFDLRPSSPLFDRRGDFGAEVHFPGSAFDAVVPAADHNLELRPSNVTYSDAGWTDLTDALIELEAAVADWRQHHADSVLEVRETLGRWQLRDTRYAEERARSLTDADLAVLVSGQKHASGRRSATASGQRIPAWMGDERVVIADEGDLVAIPTGVPQRVHR